ncbi:preprotein translocase subunit SecE [Candidatus Endobugula sertula]|uniref:Protein translocase subunit SecE n=1 Tax=Candidatus Endobugula sertula TaxID=62101 RepID=A0A1D2QM05_9GAMM|nr:preprotein translocase subunit SecE [Candidatus Endobugula sertula]
MNTKAETSEYPFNWLRWLIVVVLVVVGVVGNSYYSELGLFYRVAALLALGLLILWLAVNTSQGAVLWETVKASQTELRKVVWPTRQEINQTTLVVIVLTIAMAIILWGLDTFLGWIASLIIG